MHPEFAAALSRYDAFLHTEDVPPNGEPPSDAALKLVRPVAEVRGTSPEVQYGILQLQAQKRAIIAQLRRALRKVEHPPAQQREHGKRLVAASDDGGLLVLGENPALLRAGMKPCLDRNKL